MALAFALSSIGASADDPPRLSLDEARKYMLELINKDRKAQGLEPVALDETANKAAQGHAEEMAQNVYLSHMNLAGEKPDIRYTKAGGADSVGENTYLWWWSRVANIADTLPLQEPEQTFAKTDLEAVEATYMGEVPPMDGHRRQILNPYHTHVGIGLGRATDGKSIALANTQEFVDRYLEVEAIAQTAAAGEKIKIAGKASTDKPLYAIAIGVEPAPTPKTKAEVKLVNSYSRPNAADWLFVGRDLKLDKDGKFEKTITIPQNAPGTYYIMLWVRDDPNKTGLEGLFIASCRTVIVE